MFFLKKPFSFPFHLTNYLAVLALGLASIWWGLRGGARVGKIGEVLQIFFHSLVLEERQCGSMEKWKRKRITIFLLKKM